MAIASGTRRALLPGYGLHRDQASALEAYFDRGLVDREVFVPVVADFVIVGIEDDDVRDAVFAIEHRVEFEVC